MTARLFDSDTLWAIKPSALEGLARAVSVRDTVAPEEPERPHAFITQLGLEPLTGSRMSGIGGHTAIIPVHGIVRPTGQRSILDMLFGVNSVGLNDLAVDLRVALEDPDVDSILFDIDSPGGLVSGVQEFAEMVFDARGRKPMHAFAGDLVASAAYWIASAADEIVLAPTAEAGSIGVITSFVDWSEFDAKRGIREIVFRNSQSPNKNRDPATPEGAELIQARLDDLGEIFIETVARNRGVDAETVVKGFGEGGMFVGARAVAAGLADRLDSFDGLLSATNDDATLTSEVFGMAEQREITVELIETEHPEIASALRQQGHEAGLAEGLEAGLEQGRAEGAETERERVRAIEQKFAGMPAARALVDEHKYDDGMTVESMAMLVIEAQQAGELDYGAALVEESEPPLEDITGQQPNPKTAEEKQDSDAVAKVNAARSR